MTIHERIAHALGDGFNIDLLESADQTIAFEDREFLREEYQRQKAMRRKDKLFPGFGEALVNARVVWLKKVLGE